MLDAFQARLSPREGCVFFTLACSCMYEDLSLHDDPSTGNSAIDLTLVSDFVRSEIVFWSLEGV